MDGNTVGTVGGSQAAKGNGGNEGVADYDPNKRTTLANSTFSVANNGQANGNGGTLGVLNY